MEAWSADKMCSTPRNMPTRQALFATQRVKHPYTKGEENDGKHG